MNQIACIVQLGKFGDLTNLLPVAKHLHDKGQTPHWVVSMNYLSILKGVSYVRPDPVHFHVTRINEAMQYATAKYASVLNAQPYGKHYKGPKDVSYNVLAWRNCGFEREFYDTKNFPLIFDNRDAERERFLTAQHRRGHLPLILLALGCAQSSPFPTHHVFANAIAKRFGSFCEVVDLCDVKAARIYDWLGLFEAATVLITADSVALHLATAVPRLKVVALTNDNPFLASTPRCNVIFKTNYGKATEQMGEISTAIMKAVRSSESVRARSLDWVSDVVVPAPSCQHHHQD